jgi:CubicO group peptidase (beta-lactamase class C family)
MDGTGMIDPSKLAELTSTARGYVERGKLPSLQLALACRGELVTFETYGRVETSAGEQAATGETLYTGFSVTKAVLSSALWILIEQQRLGLDTPVVDLVPEFDTNGKDAIHVEHLLTHTAGFPNAPFAPSDWDDLERRHGRFRQWRLDRPPGSRFEYHPTATMWVVAELIERCTSNDFRDFIREMVTGPLDLDDLHVGLAPELDARVAHLVAVGDPPGENAAALYTLPEDIEAPGGFLDTCNSVGYRAVGVPGGGGIMTAAALVRFYQALLAGGVTRNGTRLWREETLRAMLTPRTGSLIDPMTGKQANRALGLVVAGDDDRIYRGFGAGCSPSSFGHNGMGGQFAWADPRSGVSFALLTNGFDRNPLRSGKRGVLLSTLAAACVAND